MIKERYNGCKVIEILRGHTKDLAEIEMALREGGQKIDVKYGYTKYVLVSESDDYVIKIWRKDNIKYNYCQREADIYARAVKWGIEFLFAPTVRIGLIEKGVPYYQQPKVERFGYRIKEDRSYVHPVLYRKVREIARENRRGRYECDMDWLSYVLKSYGGQTVKKLLMFLELNKINDLRDENVGFKDGKPILIDYSGFHGGHIYRF